MVRQKIDRLYLLEKVNWVPNPFQGSATGDHVFIRLPGIVPVKAFTDRDKAQAACRDHDAKAWAGINPFRYGNKVVDWTSLDAGRLRDWMLDLGLEPPAGKFQIARWRAWYDKVCGSLNESQLAKVREGLDRLRFYQVSELT